MAKIPFDIKYKPQIESGEYKVETRDGHPVRIICWDKKSEKKYGYHIVGLIEFGPQHEESTYYTIDGKARLKDEEPKLLIVTPESELSEFEERIFKLLRQYKECDIPLTPENIKAEASMLWQDFEKYFFHLYGKEGKGDSTLRSFYYRGLEDGKAEALKDLPRWKKIDRGNNYSSEVKFAINGRYLEMNDTLNDVYEIKLLDLEKLPKEDEK